MSISLPFKLQRRTSTSLKFGQSSRPNLHVYFFAIKVTKKDLNKLKIESIILTKLTCLFLGEQSRALLPRPLTCCKDPFWLSLEMQPRVVV